MQRRAAGDDATVADRRYRSHIVSAAGGGAATAGPVRMEELAARLVHAFAGVRVKVIALRLDQVRRDE